MADHRTEEAARYRRLYKLAIWRGKNGLRERQLMRQPLCERCLLAEIVEVATVVNHRIAHRGDWDLFVDPSNHQSLCKPHHDSDAQLEDHGKTVISFDANGWPI
ncbi:HNH endonuclease [Sinorhizobium meliloti]|uniref:HNH endonuclease n=1 Tax=Rhizobium meliloti TaxID=382 RepID=UPI000B49A274|nr:HNH endonuclease [Sinorhizobium meliloti]ASP84363.1 HNH endonuclease [Sinorhizobium meliloti]MQW28599.1 HNH endonuclease [Sinorhizobium meliloti]